MFLPLKTYVNITEGNALRMDWNDVILSDQLSYIMGNPPFVGARWMSLEQKRDVENIFKGWKSIGNLDYVSCWYKKAADYIGNNNINVHMAWTRAVCGRLKSDYSYSNTIVYNNFPWPSPTEEQQRKIENTAQAILDARALYPNSNLAALYDPLTMPTELRRAHTLNDKAVMAAYGFSTKMTEATCVTELLNLYQRMLQEKEK